MLKKLDLYIIRNIISSTLVVLFALLSIDMLGKIIAELDLVGKYDYRFTHLLLFTLGIIPLKLALFFPMSLLIGSLMGLGKLTATSELTVMQVSGVSKLRIGLIGMSVSIILGAIIVLITESVGVKLNDSVSSMRSEALHEVSSNSLKNGVWAKDSRHFVNVGGITADGKLSNVVIYSFDDQMNINNITNAQSASMAEGTWTLNDVTSKNILATRIQVGQHAQIEWTNNLNRDILTLLLFDPDDLSISDLNRFINYQKSNGIQPTNYSLAFWQRILIPLSTGVMFLLALPFIFGSNRHNSQGKKLFVGILLGLAYYISYTSIANIILLTGAPVILGALLPIVIFALISIILLWRRS